MANPSIDGPLPGWASLVVGRRAAFSGTVILTEFAARTRYILYLLGIAGHETSLWLLELEKEAVSSPDMAGVTMEHMTEVDWPDHLFKSARAYDPAAQLLQAPAKEPSVLHLTRSPEEYDVAWNEPLPLSTYLEVSLAKATHVKENGMEVDEAAVE